MLQSKWKEAKYSALERRRRALRNTAVEFNQPKIDAVFELVVKMDALAKADRKFGSELANITAELTDRSTDTGMRGQIPFFADLNDNFRANNRRRHHWGTLEVRDAVSKLAAAIDINGVPRSSHRVTTVD